MKSLSIEQRLEELRQKVNDDISINTLQELSTLINCPSADKRCYELVSLGVINSLKNPKKPAPNDDNAWHSQTKFTCYQNLVNQDNCASDVPVFLSVVSAAQSNGQNWVIPAIAKEFEVVLRPLYEKKLLNKNAILCLILIREYLGNWITQDEISRLHLKTFIEFSKGDLSLPYNNLFDTSACYRNINDLKHFFLNAENASHLKLIHMVLITWLYSKESFYPYDLTNLMDMIREKISLIAPSDYEIEISSAKTLLAHHAVNQKTLNYAKLQEVVKMIDHTNAFSSFLDFVAQNQAQIKESLMGNALPTSAHNLFKRPYQGALAFKNITERLIGISITGHKKLKIAICISGQLRGYEKAFKSWKKSFLIGVDYDIYVHSWKDVGGTNANPVRKFLPFESEAFSKAYREYCMVLGFENIKKDYPTLFKSLKHSAQVTEQEIKSFYDAKNVVLEDDDDAKFDGYTNSDKMHYKIQACHKLMRNSNINYDLAIRIRPDFSVSFAAFDWLDILDYCRAEPVIFADCPLGTQYMTCMTGDQFAVSTPDILDIYANTWDIYPKMAHQKLIGCHHNFEGHASIAINCWIHNIKFHKLPFKKGGLLNSTAMSKKMIAEAISIDSAGRNSLWDQKFSALLK